MIGSVYIPVDQIINYLIGEHTQNTDAIIILELRIPKALTAVFVGAGLAVSGVLMQSLFRNPLAGPYVLGISSGASLMVAIVLMLGGTGFLLSQAAPWLLALAAIVGAFAVLFLVLTIAMRVHDTLSLLIIGIMLAGITSSIVGLLQYFTSPQQIQHFLVWTFGNLGAVDYPRLSILIPVVALGLILSALMRKDLNSMLLGDNYAQLLGVSLRKIRMSIIVISGLLAGVITAFVGPIVFIGLAVPHLARSIFKSVDHGWLIPASALLGANLLLLCDIVAHLPLFSHPLPINSVTSLVGAPIVIWIIIKNRRLQAANF